MGLLRMAALGTAGYAIYKYATRENPEPAEVRDAGPAAMQNPPASWTATDEASDESFPASDPPSTY